MRDGAWQGGEVTVPGKGSMFYLSQRPYLVAGSLRDQILYPWPPGGVLAEAAQAGRHRPMRSRQGTPRTHQPLDNRAFRRDFSHMAPASLDDDALDVRLDAALEAVELDYLLGR